MLTLKKPAIDRAFYASMLSLALPIALQNMLSSCANLVDTAMVSGLGNISVSAVGVAGRWTFLINVMMFGLCSGSAAMISQYFGARETEHVRRTYSLSLIIAIAVALLYTAAAVCFPRQLLCIFTDEEAVIAAAVPYLRIAACSTVFLAYSFLTSSALRAITEVKLPLYSSIVSVAVNTLLNWLLINGIWIFPRLELAGAAAATLTANAIQALLIFFLSRSKLRIGGISRGIGEFVRKFLKITLPVTLNETAWALGTDIYAIVLGRQGAENYAAYMLSDSVTQLVFVFFVGLGHACAIMTGMRVGRGDHEEAYLYARRFMRITPLLAVMCGLVLLGIGEPLLALLPIETETARQTAWYLVLMYAAWMPVRMMAHTSICGVFRAGGDTKIGFVFDVSTLYFIGIPTVLVLGFVLHAPFLLIIAGMYLGEDLPKAVMCVYYFRTKKWIKQITDVKKDAPVPDTEENS